MSDTPEDQISGSIENIIFTSEDTGFTVARLKEPRKEDLTCIVGTLPSIKPGESVNCIGIWKHHPKFGKQFEVKSYKQTAPKDLVGIQKYLESGMIKGIGPSYAKRIVEAFGVKTLDVIDKTPEKLLEIEGIGEKKVEVIIQHWQDQKAIRDVMVFLQGHGVTPSLAQKIYKLYGDESIAKVKENPYALAKKLFGVGFKTADTIAKNIGIPEKSPNRVDAGIEYLLWELSSDGHTTLPESTILQSGEQLLQVPQDLIKERLTALHLQDSIKKAQMDLSGESFYWIKPLYLCETGIVRELERLQSTACCIRSIDAEKAIEWMQEQMGLKLASEQKEAAKLSLIHKLHIITGGPGTGKSTITKGILRISEKLTSKILLAAPTGRAAKRLSEITRKKAFTIHSLLEYDFNQKGFKKNKENPLLCELLIIDEASMIDTQLLYALLRAVPDQARVILIGDVDQLPSVGPGNTLKDLIESDTITVSKLKHIFRQAKGSKIITNAHSINQGYFPDISNPPNTDFIYIESEEPEEILSKIVHLVKEELPQKYGFDKLQDIQVLSPMKKGGIGTENLNHVLQQQLNPQDKPLYKMGKCFQLKDKVMQLKNNYDKKVYNGDVGIITSIDTEISEMIVDFDGKEVLYDFMELDELCLAYAVSIHKYQGSECPCIVMPVHTSHFKLLHRNLLYTGITRGKKLVVVLGNKKALAIAVKNDEVIKRHTGLKHFLKSSLPSLL